MQRGDRAPRGRRGVLAGGDAVQDGEGVVARAEGRHALERGVERRAQRVDVRAEVGRPAPRHLGGEVGRGARHHPGRGDGDVVDGAGDAEVGDLGQAVVAEQDVAGLDVAVHHPGLVGGGQRVGHLAPDVRDALGVQRPVGDEGLGEAARGQVLHDQPRLPVVLDDVVDRDRVRVVQAGDHPRLAEHPAMGLVAGLLVGTRGQRHLFEGDLPLQALVLGPPHDAHRALPDARADAVALGDQLALVRHPPPLASVHRRCGESARDGRGSCGGRRFRPPGAGIHRS